MYNFINIDNISNYEDFLNETTNYIINLTKTNDTNSDMNNMSVKIQNDLEELNKKEKISELFKEINEWNNSNINNFLKIDKKVNKELNKKLLSNKYNSLQRQLFSYSIESDLEFIEKVKSIENQNSNSNNTNYNNKNKNKFNNKSSIFDTFTDYQSLNDFNNLNPFYNESNNNNIYNNNYDNKFWENIDLGKNAFNLNLNNNFFGDASKNDDDINPFAMENNKANNNNNYFDFNYNLNKKNNNEPNLFFINNNNYDLNELNPY